MGLQREEIQGTVEPGSHNPGEKSVPGLSLNTSHLLTTPPIEMDYAAQVWG